MTKILTPDLDRFEPVSGSPFCPYCESKDSVVKAGMRKTKGKGGIQRFKCSKCARLFTFSPIHRTGYPPKVIAFAITYYNKGHTYEQTKDAVKRLLKISVPLPTVHAWMKKHTDICTFIPMRKRYDIDPRTTIQAKKLYHQQVYEFKYHQLKLNIAAKEYPRLREYLRTIAASETRNERMDRELGKMFESSATRCSSYKPPAQTFPPAQVKRLRANNATKMAGLAITLAKNRAARHEAVEDFFIANDSTTVAVEVPVYLLPEEAPELDLKEPLTGHIDLLQFRNGKVFILDYKPDQDPAAASTQLKLYAKALSKRAGIPMANIATAAFNESGYVEFV